MRQGFEKDGQPDNNKILNVPTQLIADKQWLNRNVNTCLTSYCKAMCILWYIVEWNSWLGLKILCEVRHGGIYG